MAGKVDCGAFVERFQLVPPPQPEGASPYLPLQGLTFAVKDIFDISGHITGFGNPDWAKSHAAALTTSPVVMAILKAGAKCVGKTVMDEMAYSINGENKHYGTPTNAAAPDRVPGGSSSGSAVAVAAELVDFSLGTDTGGSVRVPAAYCGIFGFRPSHGVISTDGVTPMAQSFDTVGWFARDPVVLGNVGEVLLQSSILRTEPPRLIFIPDDCFLRLSSPGSRACEIFMESVKKTMGGHVLSHFNLGEVITREVPSLHKFMHEDSRENVEGRNGNGIPALSSLSSAMRSLQRIEFARNHGEWVRTIRPDLGPGIFERVWEAITTAEENIVPECHVVRSELRDALSQLLQASHLGNFEMTAYTMIVILCGNAVLALPTVPGPPPRLLTEASMLAGFRAKAFGLLSVSGMSGLCQVTMPLGMDESLPMSISLLANRGEDLSLLNLVRVLHRGLREQAVASEKPVS